MLICGINASHTASAVLIEDGKVLSAIQEERPTRLKNKSGYPGEGIQRLLDMQGLDWEAVDAWVFGGFETYTELGLTAGDRADRVRSYRNMAGPLGQVRRALRDTPARSWLHRSRRAAHLRCLATHGVPRSRVSAIDHHQCHAASAYFGPGADRDALVITVDGAGDSLCATVSIPDADGRLRRLSTVEESHSIGNLWAVITSLLAMVPMEHEYKLMGMAPYASGSRVDEAVEIFRRSFRATADGAWEVTNGVPDMMYSYHYWRKQFEFIRFDCICAGLQIFTEEFLTAWVKGWLRKTGRRKLRLAGGVFMNVKLNKTIGELPEVDDLFVFPSCGDETNAFGAAWALMADRGDDARIEPLDTLYLGPDTELADCERSAIQAREWGWRVITPPSIEEAAAELLAQGEIVARACGREEFGARALGNRSILADPARMDLLKVVNKAIKNRDFWMPFAPSIMAEHADRYVHNPKGFAAPYMILAFDSLHTGEVQAACHPEDGTIRPHIVSQEGNPSYHRLLQSFHRKTGRGAILNTSLNIHGEPIVSSPDDALDVMRRSGLVHLALGPHLISKPGTP